MPIGIEILISENPIFLIAPVKFEVQEMLILKVTSENIAKVLLHIKLDWDDEKTRGFPDTKISISMDESKSDRVKYF